MKPSRFKVQPTSQLSTLLALAATAIALPTPADGAVAAPAPEIADRDASDSKLAERQKNPNCFGGGYFECVNMHNFACNAGCIGAHGAAKISCMISCQQHNQDNCARWCA
jgi:hypothetical protein